MNLIRGSRLTNDMGLRMREGVPYKFATDYSYVEIPLGSLYNPVTEEDIETTSSNQYILIKPACSLEITGLNKVLVKTNPKLQEYALTPSLLLLDHKSGEQPFFYAHFRKKMSREDIDWAVRLYLLR